MGNVRVIAQQTEGLQLDAVRTITDELKAAYDDIVVLLSVHAGNKYNLVCAAGKAAVQAGAHAGNIVRAAATIAGGGGGGRPDTATAGIKQPEKLQQALDAVASAVSDMLK